MTGGEVRGNIGAPITELNCQNSPFPERSKFSRCNLPKASPLLDTDSLSRSRRKLGGRKCCYLVVVVVEVVGGHRSPRREGGWGNDVSVFPPLRGQRTGLGTSLKCKTLIGSLIMLLE